MSGRVLWSVWNSTSSQLRRSNIPPHSGRSAKCSAATVSSLLISASAAARCSCAERVSSARQVSQICCAVFINANMAGSLARRPLMVMFRFFPNRNLLACYRELSTAKPHRDLVRAVPTARLAHPICIGSLARAVDVIGIETPLVRHGGNQHAVAIDVDETRGRPTPEEVHRVQAMHFV